jgi:hypothetical protein
MTALRRRKIVAAFLKLTRRARRKSSSTDGPGCTCASCVQAWDRHHPVSISPARRSRLMRLGLY